MSNPTFSSGNLTREAGKPVVKFHLVKTIDGKVEHNDAATFPYGAVTESADPKTAPDINDTTHGLPFIVRVHTEQSVVKIATADTFGVDDVVFAAADGAVSKTGTVKVGVAAGETDGGLVRVHLFHPAILGGAGAAEGNA